MVLENMLVEEVNHKRHVLYDPIYVKGSRIGQSNEIGTQGLGSGTTVGEMRGNC